jgi:hypothetical protein
MAKGTLKFDLPEEEKSHLRAVKAMDLVMCLYDFTRWLKTVDDIDKPLSPAEVKSAFYAAMDDNDVNLEELS